MTLLLISMQTNIPCVLVSLLIQARFQFHVFLIIFLFLFLSTYLTVVVCHCQQGDRAVGVAPITDSCHVSIPHDRHCGQGLAGCVWMRQCVIGSGRRGKLGAQGQVLLHWLVLALEVEL